MQTVRDSLFPSSSSSCYCLAPRERRRRVSFSLNCTRWQFLLKHQIATSTLKHGPVGRVGDGEDVRWYFVPLLALVQVDDLLRVDGQTFVGVHHYAEKSRVCLCCNCKKRREEKIRASVDIQEVGDTCKRSWEREKVYSKYKNINIDRNKGKTALKKNLLSSSSSQQVALKAQCLSLSLKSGRVACVLFSS